MFMHYSDRNPSLFFFFFQIRSFVLKEFSYYSYLQTYKYLEQIKHVNIIIYTISHSFGIFSFLYHIGIE